MWVTAITDELRRLVTLTGEHVGTAHWREGYALTLREVSRRLLDLAGESVDRADQIRACAHTLDDIALKLSMHCSDIEDENAAYHWRYDTRIVGSLGGPQNGRSPPVVGSERFDQILEFRGQAR